jgi:hypothetical protein
MMTMCPSCFELYSEIWSKPCCDCDSKTISVSVELIRVVKLLINLGFKVSSASCNTHASQDGSGKITQVNIELGKSYPETFFQKLPPDWTIYEFNLVKDNQILQPKLTGLSCVCEHPPSECDAESVSFDKELTICNLEVWLEEKDPESYRAMLTLAGCL